MFKKLLSLLIITILFCNCSSDSVRSRNPHVPNYPVNFTINMELPMYNSLQYVSNAVLITIQGVGANGIIVFNAGGSYRAFEANCPNMGINYCSRLQINGVKAICPCDEQEYSLFTGVPDKNGNETYPLISYRIEQMGNILRIYN